MEDYTLLDLEQVIGSWSLVITIAKFSNLIGYQPP